MKKLLLLILLLKHSEAYHKSLLGTASINCSNSGFIANDAVTKKFFKEQHSLVMIDFSKVLSSQICAFGGFSKSYELLDDFRKVVMKPIDKSGLSEYPKNRGIHVKGNFKEVSSVLAQIAKMNPRSKVMIQITDGDLQMAKKILHDGFHINKMLDVAVAMSSSQNKTMDFCLYNPFAGDGLKRSPQFKCWTLTLVNYMELLEEALIFIHNRVRNLQKYPLKVSIFQHSILALPIRNNNGRITGYDYPDGRLVYHLSHKMNFVPIYFHPSEIVKQGFQLPNGSFTGSLGAIETGQADYSANSLLISSSYNTSNVLFSSPLGMEKIVFIIQRRKSPRSFRVMMFSEFDKTSRNIIVALTSCLPILYVVVTKLESKFLRIAKKVEIIKGIFYVIALQFNVSMKHRSLLASRFMIFSILFLTLIMNSILQGKITSSLHSNRNDGKIKTMNELIANNYRLVIHNDVKSILNDLGGRWKKTTSNSNSIMMNNWQGLNEVFNHSNVAFLISNLYTGNYLDRYYDNVTSENTIEEVPEVIFQSYASPLIPKNSPFVEQFKELTMRYCEVGLRNYHFNRANFDKNKIMMQRILTGNVPKRIDKRIEFDDLHSIFLLYFLLNGVAFVVFLTEFLYQLLLIKCAMFASFKA